MTAAATATTTTSSTTSSSITPNNSVILAASRLIPLFGSMTVAHDTRAAALEMLQRAIDHRARATTKISNDLHETTTATTSNDDDTTNDNPKQRSMIIDITATTWNWDTYAIVAGHVEPVHLFFADKARLLEHVTLSKQNVENGGVEQIVEVVQSGVLVPQTPTPTTDGNEPPATTKMVWVPKGAVLQQTPTAGPSSDPNDAAVVKQFTFVPKVDPNDDRLEHFEQQAVTEQLIRKQRIRLVSECMRNMMRFYNLDRVVCWDLSWGIWEAVRCCDADAAGYEDDDEKFPDMVLVRCGEETEEHVPFPSLGGGGSAMNDETIKIFYDCAKPITPDHLADSLKSVAGYYLVGGNTYTMSLFHHMWDQHNTQQQPPQDTTTTTTTATVGHMQLLRDLLKSQQLFYMGHSAGAIMSGPNILTATWKGIDAFSIVTQPYLRPFLKLPPWQTPETFFVPSGEKNRLTVGRRKMLENMRRYGAWNGWNVVEVISFPHYDSRPRFESFPQSAECYLGGTDEKGVFDQTNASLLVGTTTDESEDDGSDIREEPMDVRKIREETNERQISCIPIANGHCIILPYQGMEIADTTSPKEEGCGTLKWDTYMPNVKDKDWDQYKAGRMEFMRGSFTNDDGAMAGDRSMTSGYNGGRIMSRLRGLGLLSPGYDSGSVGEEGKGKGGLFLL